MKKDGILNILGDRVLFLGCHCDDIEFGCGGLVTLISQSNNKRINLTVLSKNNLNSNGEVQIERDLNEAYRSMINLGVNKDNIKIHDFPGQMFEYSRQSIREFLIEEKLRVCPTSVFYPGKDDIHQDHKALADEAYRIFRGINCFGYEVIRSTKTFSPTVYIELNEQMLDKKIESIQYYETQKSQSANYYFESEVVKNIAGFRGAQVGYKYAEAFESYIIYG